MRGVVFFRGGGGARGGAVESVVGGEFTPLVQEPIEPSVDDQHERSPQAITEAEGSNSTLSTSSALLAICNGEVEGIQVAMEDNLFELGISSLTLAQIHAAIEEQWPDQVDITDLFDYPTVAELAAFLDSKNSA